MRLMKYVENTNRNDGTRAIAVGDGRPTIQMGGSGEMTEQEIANAVAMGHVLVDVDDGGLSKMKVSDLDSKAGKLGVELDDDDDRDTKVAKIRARLADGPEDMSEVALGGSAATGPGGTSATIAPGPATSTSTSTATT